MKKLAIFDLDGTLIDTLLGLNVCMNRALQKNGIEDITLDDTRRFVGNGIKNYVIRAANKGLPADLSDDLRGQKIQSVAEDFLNIYGHDGIDESVLYDGIDYALNVLRSHDVKLAVLSNKAQYAADIFNERFLSKYSFDLVLGQTDDLPLKPAPDGLLKILEKLNVEKADAVMIGDGETDYLTAKNAGIDCVSVLWGFRSEEELKSAGATVFISNPKEIPTALGIIE